MQPRKFYKISPIPKKQIFILLAWVDHEILAGLPPYCDVAHDLHLALKICEGLRPKLNLKTPQLLEELIKKCWDDDPTKRPTAQELSDLLNNWYQEIKDKKDTEFTQQVKEAETFNKALPAEIIFPKPEKHQGAVYHSKLLPTKEITQLLNKSSQSQLDSQQIDLEIPTNLDQFNLNEENSEQ